MSKKLFIFIVSKTYFFLSTIKSINKTKRYVASQQSFIKDKSMIKKLLITALLPTGECQKALIIAGVLNYCQKPTKVKNQQNYYIKI